MLSIQWSDPTARTEIDEVDNLYSFVIQLGMKKPDGAKSRIVPVRVSQPVYEALRHEAGSRGLSCSAFIRMVIMKELAPVKQRGAMEQKHNEMRSDFLRLSPLNRILRMEKIRDEAEKLRSGAL